MNLDDVEYYYIRNIQGDVIGLFDKNGVQIASYSYDSWGKLLSIKDRGELTKEEVSDLFHNGVKVDRSDIQTRYQYNELKELVKEETKANDGLLAYYSFDGKDAKDDSGNGNHGSLIGTPSFATGKRGYAVILDGIDDYVELKDFDVPEDFSISLWVERTI